MIFFVKFLIMTIIRMAIYSDDEKSVSPRRQYLNSDEKYTESNKEFEKYLNKHKVKHSFLKKGTGKLASSNHGITEYAAKRKNKIYQEQEKLEHNPVYLQDPFEYKYGKK
jgi:hypothetical protein